VRSNGDARVCPQLAVDRQWFFLKHVENGVTQPAFTETHTKHRSITVDSISPEGLPSMQLEGLLTVFAHHAYSRCTVSKLTANHRALHLSGLAAVMKQPLINTHCSACCSISDEVHHSIIKVAHTCIAQVR